MRTFFYESCDLGQRAFQDNETVGQCWKATKVCRHSYCLRRNLKVFLFFDINAVWLLCYFYFAYEISTLVAIGFVLVRLMKRNLVSLSNVAFSIPVDRNYFFPKYFNCSAHQILNYNWFRIVYQGFMRRRVGNDGKKLLLGRTRSEKRYPRKASTPQGMASERSRSLNARYTEARQSAALTAKQSKMQSWENSGHKLNWITDKPKKCSDHPHTQDRRREQRIHELPGRLSSEPPWKSICRVPSKKDAAKN